MPRPRLFIAFPVATTIRQRVESLPTEWSAGGSGVAWSPMEELHVTTLFLGDVPTTDWMMICKAVHTITSEVMTFDLSLKGLSAFPNPRRPRVVYAGLERGVEELTSLHEALADELAVHGYYVREERGYNPHLTVGRVHAEDQHEAIAQELTKWTAWDGGRMTVSDLTIYSSEQRRGRYEYTVVGKYPLDG